MRERDHGGLLAGTASADVTPPVGLWNVGARRSERIRDDLRATAFVLQVGSERLAIVSVEVIQLIRESVAAIRERVAAETGIPAERTLVLYAHTHSSPITRPSRGKMPDDDYVRVLEKATAGAVMMAAQRLVPARIAFGEGHIGFNVNRRRMTPGGVQMLPNPDGPVDRRVRVLRVDAVPAGVDAPLAVLFSVCCHPTSFPTSTATGADYPGAARRVIEHIYRGETKALFLPGTFGNVRPAPVDAQGRFRSVTDVELDRIGRALGAEVVHVAEEVSGIPREPGTVTPTWDGTGGLGAVHHDVPLRYRSVPSREEILASTSPFEQPWKEQMLSQLARDGRLPDGEPCEVQVMRLGPFLVVAIGGEPFVETGRAIEARLVATPGIAAVLVLGYANGSAGYLCTAQANAEGGYESAQAYFNSQRPGPYADDTEAAIVAAVGTLAQRLV